ncbi:MAG: tetratricopeptide repeat protein [Chloroflexi bacterium]|nr:tetratricopeptide repeat protein [Chloroflexota bacterium]
MSDELKEAGLALFRQGQRQEAIARFEEAAASYAAAGDKTGEGEALNNIGVIRRLERDWPAAQEAFQRAQTLFAETGDQARQAQVTGNLGDLYAYQGQTEEAARAYSDAAEMMAAAGDREKQAQLLRALSLLRLRQRRIMESMLLMGQSLEVRPRLSFPQRIFRALIQFMLSLMGRA